MGIQLICKVVVDESILSTVKTDPKILNGHYYLKQLENYSLAVNHKQ